MGVLAPFDFAFGYLDDILIYSPDVNTHLHHLELVFQRLREVDLKLKMEWNTVSWSYCFWQQS